MFFLLSAAGSIARWQRQSPFFVILSYLIASLKAFSKVQLLLSVFYTIHNNLYLFTSAKQSMSLAQSLFSSSSAGHSGEISSKLKRKKKNKSKNSQENKNTMAIKNSQSVLNEVVPSTASDSHLSEQGTQHMQEKYFQSTSPQISQLKYDHFLKSSDILSAKINDLFHSIIGSIKRGISSSRKREQGSSQQTSNLFTRSLEELETLRTLSAEFFELSKANTIFNSSQLKEFLEIKQSIIPFYEQYEVQQESLRLSTEANNRLQRELSVKSSATQAISRERLKKFKSKSTAVKEKLNSSYREQGEKYKSELADLNGKLYSSQTLNFKLQEELKVSRLAESHKGTELTALEQELRNSNDSNIFLQSTLERVTLERDSLRKRTTALNARLFSSLPSLPTTSLSTSLSNLSTTPPNTSRQEEIDLLYHRLDSLENNTISYIKCLEKDIDNLINIVSNAAPEGNDLASSFKNPPADQQEVQHSPKPYNVIKLIIKDLPLDIQQDCIISSLTAIGSSSFTLGKTFTYTRSRAFSQVLFLEDFLAKQIMNSPNPSVTIGNYSYPIAFFINYHRCDNCQELGHLAKSCTNSLQFCASCGGSGHSTANCYYLNNPAYFHCVNCESYNYKNPAFQVNPLHQASSKSCHSFKLYIKEQTALSYASLFSTNC